jgi:hypothetical protein
MSVDRAAVFGAAELGVAIALLISGAQCLADFMAVP